MALKAIVEAIDTVPEAARAFYTENDGKFILDVESVDGYALEDVSGLKGTLGKEMTLRKKLEKEVVRFKDIDPEKAREALVKLEELGNFDPSKDADKIVSERLEAAKRQLIEKQAKEIEPLKGRIGQLTSYVEKLLIDNAATAALAEAQGSVELLLPHVQKHTRVREQDGEFTVEVVGKDGNARIGNSKGDAMTIAELVQEMRSSETFGRAFEGTGHRGSGTPPKNTGESGKLPGGAPKSWSDAKTPEEKAAFIKSKNATSSKG